MNVNKIIGKLEIKKEIYIDVKTDKDEYVKSIIYLYIYIYIYIYICKKKGINNNYVVNDMAMIWRNRSSAAINPMLKLLVIYRLYRYRFEIMLC